MRFFYLLIVLLIFSANSYAVELNKSQSEALKQKIEVIKKMANDKSLIEAVQKINSSPLLPYKNMTQEIWTDLPIVDPKIKFFYKNPIADFFKSSKDDSMAEIILNAADGTKVAFLSKPSFWSHKGKPKHDDPMMGKDWIGKIETDESTGSINIQISVPVISEGKPIGSLIVGFIVARLN